MRDICARSAWRRRNPSDAIEQLLEHLSGGHTAVKFYYIIDRRDFLEKAKLLESEKPSRPEAR
jgi:hypothetical protein